MSTLPQRAAALGRREVVASRIRGLMGEQRRTGAELGRAIGVATSSFSRRTTGEIDFGIAEVETLAQVFGVTEAYLYGFTDTRSAEPRPEALAIFDPRGATPTGGELITSERVVDLSAYRSQRLGGQPRRQAPLRPSRPAQRPLWPVDSALSGAEVSA